MFGGLVHEDGEKSICAKRRATKIIPYKGINWELAEETRCMFLEGYWLDDNLKNILGFNESDDLTKTENTTEDLNLENLMDDELIQLLEDNNAENVKKSSVTSDSVPKQIAQKLSQIDNDESIEMLYDETPQGENGEAQINIQESPVVKSAVNKTKKIAVSLFLILILLAGGATTYFMKFGKTEILSYVYRF